MSRVKRSRVWLVVKLWPIMPRRVRLWAFLKKFDITKLFTTRNGLKVRILCTDRMCMVGDAWQHPIVGLITEKGGYEVVGSWNHDGTWTDSDNPDPYDLVNIPLEYVDGQMDD